jgi:hypothetical protein
MEFDDEFNQCITRLVGNTQDTRAFDSAINAIVNSHVLYSKGMRKKPSKATELSISEIQKCERMHNAIPATHSEIANNFIQNYGEISPVGTNGKLWVYNPTSGLWEANNLPKDTAEIGRKYVKYSKSVKHGDYKSLSNLVYDETQ